MMIIMTKGLQTILSMNYAVLVRGTVNIFRKMVGLPEATWNKDDNDKKEEDDKSHLHSKCNIQQQNHNQSEAKYHFRFYDINSFAITISFIAYTSSVKV
jgi:hypothetical protein